MDARGGTAMSVRTDRGGWEMRWLDGSGRKRAKRFKDEREARVFDAAVSEVAPLERRADTATYGSRGGGASGSIPSLASVSGSDSQRPGASVSSPSGVT